MSLLRGLVLTIAAASSACIVSRARYDECVSDAAKAKAAADAKGQSDASQMQALGQQIAAAEAATQDRDAKLSELSTSAHNVQAQLDEATAINQQLREELQRLGKDVDKILADRGTLSKALDDAKSRLEELRKAQASAEARTQVFRDFERRFKPLEDAGQLRVEARRGHLVMNVAGDLLFDPGHAELRSAGKGVLMEIARALQTTSPPSTGRRFLVTAHLDAPDTTPPARGAKVSAEEKARRSRSPWDLTATRAVNVVEYLVSIGVPAESLTAAGAGWFDPIAPNDGADGRARNRRLEIALFPSADEAPRAEPIK